MPLPLGTTFIRPFSGYQYPKKKRRWALPARQIFTYTVTVTDTVTLSQSIISQGIYNRALSDSITLSQSLGSQGIYNRALSNDVSIAQIVFKVGKITTLSLSHDVTLVPTIRLGKIVQFKLSDSVSTSTLMHQLANVVHSVSITDAIVLKRVLKRSVSHNVSITEGPFVNSPRVLFVTHNVAVTDFYAPYLATFRFLVSDSVTLADSISERLGTYRATVIDTVTIGQFIRQIGALYFFTVTDTVSIVSKVNRQYLVSLHNDVALFPVIAKHREITRTVVTSLSGSTDFARDTNFSIITQLNLTSIFSHAGSTYHRGFETDITLNQTFNNILFIPNPGPHGVVSGVNIVYGYLTLLESPVGTIVLPLPELNDSQKHNDSVQLKRSMSGRISAYVKKSTTQILTYTWLLDYTKALEFKQWALTSFSQNITLTNWKGEIWYGRILNDDLGLKAETKYAGPARQKTSVTLQFEGIKING
jgi:hypothetical protein